jgi:chitinase
MKCFRILSIINGVILSSNVAAATIIKPAFSPYVDFTLNTHWDPQTQEVQPMDLATPAQTHGIKGYHLAFITDSGNCQPAWGGQQDYSIDKKWGTQQTDLLAKNDVQLTVSFGGAANNDISHNCDVNQLVNAYSKVVTTYHATSLDFDIENGTANVPKLLQALKVVQKAHDKVKLSFTLPVMPEGLTAEGKAILSAANDAGLKFNVNIMAMDYGPGYTGDMGAYAIEAIINLHQFLQEMYPEKIPQVLWQFIEVTPMIGVNDVNTEQFTLNNADKLKQFAQNKQLGGLSMWSLNRDKPCADKWTNTNCSGNNLQTQDYEFVKHFQ